MSAILSGVVRVVVETTGKGDAPAKVKQSEKAIKDYEKAVGAAGEATEKTNTSVAKTADAVKASLKPVDAARGLFENLRSNFLAMPLAIGGVVAGIVSFIDQITSAGSAAERIEKLTGEWEQNLGKVEQRLDKLREFMGETKGESLFGAEAGDEAAKLVDQVLTLEERLRDVRAQEEMIKEIVGELVYEQLPDYDARIAKITKLQHEIRDAAEKEAEFRERIGRALIAAANAMRLLIPGGLSGFAAGAKRGNVIDLDAFGGPLVIPPGGPGGGGGRRASQDPLAALLAQLSAGADRNAADFARRSDTEEARAFRERLDSYGTDLGGRMLAAANDNALGISFGGGRSRADDIRDFTSALSDSLPVMGEFASMVSQLSETWTKWGEGSLTTRDAVVGSLGAIAKAGAQQIKDERLRAGVLSIIELGLGFANLANPAIAAGHFTASAILGSVALFSGGSGSSKGSSGSGSGGRTPAPRVGGGDALGGGNITYIINAPWFGPAPQESAAGVVSFIERPRGTGFERGRDAA